MSSFMKRVFGFGNNDESMKDDSSSSTQDKTKDVSCTNHNSLKCKAILAPYTIIKEEVLQLEHLSLFDGNLVLLDKLNEKFIEEVKSYQRTVYTDTFRPKEANSSGGIDFNNKEVTSQIRSTGTEIIKQVGKKILSGDFNLTTISFPIRVMIPISMVQACAYALYSLPYFMYFANGKDVVERLKLTIVATLCPFFCSAFFLKPLNPVLGETFEGYFSDGSQFYVEQSSHHPPVSHYQIYGPNNSYQYCGYSSFSSSAGLNSLGVSNKGKRFMKFKDGVQFDFGFFEELYSNSFWGVLKSETTGEVKYIEKNLNVSCVVKIGKRKGEPSDCIYGEVMIGNKVVSVLKGSYMSYIEFDDVRYWDIRQNYPIQIIEKSKNLPSSSLYREDRTLLEEGKIKESQTAKERIENLQRNDRKLRKEYKK